jgi:hypothetical protein
VNQIVLLMLAVSVAVGVLGLLLPRILPPGVEA